VRSTAGGSGRRAATAAAAVSTRRPALRQGAPWRQGALQMRQGFAKGFARPRRAAGSSA
jgi:hypothetical protein